jgi:hypothetical protein
MVMPNPSMFSATRSARNGSGSGRATILQIHRMNPEPPSDSGSIPGRPFFQGPALIVAVALVAAFIKLVIALNTLGTNDVVAFYQFAKAVEAHGLPWAYENSILFNHPPLVGYLLHGLASLSRLPFLQENGITFPFLLRLPGIAADFAVVLLVLLVVREYPRLRPPTWALLLFAASPVSLMVTGFHGNTDAIMLLFLVAAAILAARGQPLLCGLLLALSCQVKIIPLLLLPIFFFLWTERRWSGFFVASFVLSSLLFSLEPLLRAPLPFLKNVLAYGSFWGVWGITYGLRMTGLDGLDKTSFFALSVWQNGIMTALKIIVIGSILVLAWRRRKLPAESLFATIGYAWLLFFVFSPAVAAQYLVWLAPFILLLSPAFYGVLTVACSVFLFALYTIMSGGFPWYFGHASNKLSSITAHSALLPWLCLVGGLVFLVWQARRHSPDFRIMSLAAPGPPRNE